MCCAVALTPQQQHGSGDSSFVTYYNRFRNDHTVRDLTFVSHTEIVVPLELYYIGPVSYFFRNYTEMMKLFALLYDIHDAAVPHVQKICVSAQLKFGTSGQVTARDGGDPVIYPVEPGAPVGALPRNDDEAWGHFVFDALENPERLPNDNVVVPDADDPAHYPGRIVLNVIRKHSNGDVHEISRILRPFHEQLDRFAGPRPRRAAGTRRPQDRGAGDGLPSL